MAERRVLKRGDVWTAAGGAGYSSKPRPVIVIQSDRFPHNDSILVCPLTTDTTPAALFRIPIDPDPDNGLRKPSVAMIDKMGAIQRVRVGTRLGALSANDMARINLSVFLFLGLG